MRENLYITKIKLNNISYRFWEVTTIIICTYFRHFNTFLCVSAGSNYSCTVWEEVGTHRHSFHHSLSVTLNPTGNVSRSRCQKNVLFPAEHLWWCLSFAISLYILSHTCTVYKYHWMWNAYYHLQKVTLDLFTSEAILMICIYLSVWELYFAYFTISCNQKLFLTIHIFTIQDNMLSSHKYMNQIFISPIENKNYSLIFVLQKPGKGIMPVALF